MKMGFAVSTPIYTYLRASGYIFRLRLPADFKPVVGKSGFRYSLRSGILAVAKTRTQAIAGYIKKLFRRIRASISEWTQEQINKAVRVYVRETLANVENCRAMPQHSHGRSRASPR